MQTPVDLQVAGRFVAQSLSGSVLSETAPQKPFAPPPFKAFVHAWQAPLQASLQQTPSTQ